MAYKIAVLPGDGVGREVIAEAVKVLKALKLKGSQEFIFTECLVGGAAIDEVGVPLPPETLETCLNSDAILFGAVGGPKWNDVAYHLRPEKALLDIRQTLGLYANLRPVKVYPALVDASPLKREIVEGVDILVVRELTGGIYFGNPRGIEIVGATGGSPVHEERGLNTLVYTASEIRRIAKLAFEIARKRRKILTSVDKANVLETMQLWRRTVTEVARDYPDVTVEHLYVDNCAMQLIRSPKQFDVIVTENMFGDILSDEAAMLTGSIGMLPSASIGGKIGFYEPIHGSAPDIAGKNKANPIAAIASAALMLRYSLHLENEATRIERAILTALEKGYRTQDIAQEGTRILGTQEMGDVIAENLA
ncbi:MAG TPA: 3-isopropylmalate dehydrogenase [Candidatus Limnocylindrales bacterium]|nr:3-isopropylmalate dehydrogenase [Candidatus Limnocylindrales bacterium]